MSNIKTIAADLGVSSATVSNALSGNGRVSDAMVERVRLRANELGFFPSTTARALKTGRTAILGLVMPDLTNPLFPKLAQSVETAATNAGYGVLIADSRGSIEDQSAAIQRLHQRGVDGLVIVPHRGTRPMVKAIPTAIIHTPTDPQNTVSSDHAQGGRLAAQALIDMGHKSFLLIGGDQTSEVQNDRILGMISAINDIGEGVGHYKVFWSNVDFPDLAKESAAGVTAVLTTSDLVALRVLSDAHQSGLKVPKALSVMGFDDLPLGLAVRPMLSTVEQDVTAIAETAIDFLKAKIEKTEPKPDGVAIKMKLLLRGTTDKPLTSLNKPLIDQQGEL